VLVAPRLRRLRVLLPRADPPLRDPLRDPPRLEAPRPPLRLPPREPAALREPRAALLRERLPPRLDPPRPPALRLPPRPPPLDDRLRPLDCLAICPPLTATRRRVCW
jgi:hypothetical protein